MAHLEKRIYATVNNVTSQMLHNTWVKVEYWLDIFHATNGSCVDVYRNKISFKLGYRAVNPRKNVRCARTFYFLWRFVKDQVDRTAVRDFIDFRERISAAVNNVTSQMLHNTWVEVEHRLDVPRATNGSHAQVYGTRDENIPVFTLLRNWFNLQIRISSEVIVISFIILISGTRVFCRKMFLV